MLAGAPLRPAVGSKGGHDGDVRLLGGGFGQRAASQAHATLKDTVIRAGQSSERTAPIRQHSADERQEEVAAGLDATVRKAKPQRSASHLPSLPARIRHTATDDRGQRKGPGL